MARDLRQLARRYRESGEKKKTMRAVGAAQELDRKVAQLEFVGSLWSRTRRMEDFSVAASLPGWRCGTPSVAEPSLVSAGSLEFDDPYSFLADGVTPLSVGVITNAAGDALAVIRAERLSEPLFVLWQVMPASAQPASVALPDAELGLPRLTDYVWVDLATGRIGWLEKTVPVGSSPVLLAPNRQTPRRTEWCAMRPAEIVDAWYSPWQERRMWRDPSRLIKSCPTNEVWCAWPTEKFLPCIDKYGQFKYRDWPGKTHSDAELAAAVAEEERDLAAHPGPADRDVYGGWTEGPQLEATGRFRTVRHGGRWWLVDPEGRLFWSFGAVRVTPSSALTPLNGNPRTPLCGRALPDRDCLFEGLPSAGEPLAAFYDTADELLLPLYLKRGETRRFDHSAANLCRKYGADWFAKFSDSCHRRLRSWGANTIANSSDLRICLQDRTPYAERVECQSRGIEGSWGDWGKFRDPFDPSFTSGVRDALAAHGREAHDPWCIGFFIDNEINWGGNDTQLARWVLRSPDDQPAKVEFKKRLAKKGIVPGRDEVPEGELRAFNAALVEEYFRRTRETVKAFDPKLLYLGCRFAGRARDWVIGPCVRYCDVVSFNIYRESLADWSLPEGLDAPVLIGEFHFGAFDRGLFGSGQVNAGTQEGRARMLKAYVASALDHPQIVGVHWHQFSDQSVTGRFDGEFFQVGWTDVCDRPYPETRTALREIAYPLYARRSAAQAKEVKK